MKFQTTILQGDKTATADPEAAQFFDGLSYSHKSSYVLWIESAKKDETRQRRIPEAVRMLKEGRKQR